MPGFMGQYGYAQAPGRNGAYGYYEQQTPAGSFAAANQQFARGAAPAQQQWAGTSMASNPFIGQQSQGIAGAQSVMPWAQQIANQSQQANPYIGQQSAQAQQVGGNAFGGGNPYLGQAIDAASQDAIRNYTTAVRPQLDSLARASGSFGNTAIQEMQQNAMGDLGRNLGNIANSARMQDYTQQQQLAENALGRQQQMDQFNASLGAQDLARNTAGYFQGQQIGQQGLNSLLGAAQFDAGNTMGMQQFNAGLGAQDLSRNAQLAQGLGQFNAGQSNTMGQFNAGQGNQLAQFNANLGQQNAQFNAGQGNAINQFNTGQANSMLGQVRGLNENARQFDANLGANLDQFNRTLTEQGRQFDANLGNNRYQFDQGLDWNIDRDTWNRQMQGLQTGLNIYDRMIGNNNYAMGIGNTVQGTPMQYWQQFTNGANQIAGNGGSLTQQMYGNPFLGAIGGWQLGGALFPR